MEKEVLSEVKAWVQALPEDEQSLFAFVPGLVNSKATVILAPCGSKKGWPEDKQIEKLRQRFVNLLETFNYEDGSSPWNWIEVGYGEFGQKVLRGNCKNRYDDRDYADESEATQ